MGLLQSRESYLAEEKASGGLNRDTLRFPGFKERDEEFLKHAQETEAVFNIMTDIIRRLASLTGLSDAVGYILEIAKSPIFDLSIEKAMLELKIEKIVVDTVHILVKAEMESVIRQLNLINDPQLSTDQKRNDLKTADDSCYRLLVKFRDEEFYLRKYPLAFAPFLMSFVAVYVPIAAANYQMTPTETRREEYVRNMQELKNTVDYFKERAIEERLSYIKKNVHGGERPFITDEFLDEDIVIHILLYTYPDIFNDVYDWYCDKVREKYAEYFQPGLRALENLELENLELENVVPVLTIGSNITLFPKSISLLFSLIFISLLLLIFLTNYQMIYNNLDVILN